MITKPYKKILDTFIALEYKTIKEVATTLHNQPDELINITYESIVNGNETKWLKESFNSNRIYLYFYISLRNQRNMIYRRSKQLKYADDMDVSNIEDNSLDDDWISKYDEIINMVKALKTNGSINFYQERIFMLFYAPEKIIDIDKVDDIHALRNMSLRKLADITNINYVSIHYTLRTVMEKIVPLLTKYDILI